MGYTASAHLTQFGSATVDIGVLFTLKNFKIRQTGWNFVGTQVLASDNGTTFTQIALLPSYQHDTDYVFNIAPMAVRYIRFNDLNNFTPGPGPNYTVTFTEIPDPNMLLNSATNTILLNSGTNQILKKV